MREKIVADADLFLRFQEAVMVMFKELARCNASPVRFDCDWCAMRIRSGYHEHPVAFEAMVAGEDIGWQVSTGKVTHVHVTVSVGPGDAYMNGLGHDIPLNSALVFRAKQYQRAISL
jgi:hypothetical protein